MPNSQKKIFDFLNSGNNIRWCLLSVVLLAFAITVYPSMLKISEYNYQPGDIAKADVKAPKDIFIEDQETTEEKRKQAVRDVLTIYDYDDTLIIRLTEDIQKAFDNVRKVYETIHAEEEELAPATQEPLPWQRIIEKKTVHDRIWETKTQFEKTLNIHTDENEYRILARYEFSKTISDLVIRILIEILENGVVSGKETLLRENESGGIIVRILSVRKELVLTDVRRYYSIEQAKSMVRIIAQPLLRDMPYTILNPVADLTQKLIQPNLTLNRSETEERRKKAAESIKAVLYKIKAGEIIIREGERVTEGHLRKLNALRSQAAEESTLARSMGAILMMMALILILFSFSVPDPLSLSNKDLLFMGCMLSVFFFLLKISSFFIEALVRHNPLSISATSLTLAIPLAASSMTICLFMRMRIAGPFALITAACTGIILQNRLEMFFYFLLNGLMAAYWVRHCRERKVFIKAGAKLGILNIALATALKLHTGEFPGIGFLWDVVFAFIGGIGTGIISAGLVALVESAFNYTTDITLLELSNLERPLLRRLMIEAPGTYHHSVVVGTMVEAAAAEIGANPLLVKVSAYYHDIGKIRKPLYFIENQMNAANRHEKLAPTMSGLILIAHVKDGVEIGRENKLGQPILDTIRQHHGTSLIRYFYEKAKARGVDTLTIEDFRYPGPKPQTREIGLVMLADVVEASSRTLENPTPSRIQGHVKKIMDAVLADGQLNECDLTLKDLYNIEKAFNKILNGIHHHRIEYVETPDGKEKKNGSSYHQSAKPAFNIPGKGATNGTDTIRCSEIP